MTNYRDVSLTTAHKKLRADISQFSAEYIQPVAAKIDELEQYPLEILNGLANAGFTKAAFPKTLGGTELDSLSWSLIIAEVAKASGSSGLALGVTGTASLPILHLGTPQQTQALIPVIDGDTPGVYAQSEPEQGSDVARIRTTATPITRNHVSGWELIGHKVWISNAWLGPDQRAQWAVVLAQTGEVGNRRTMRFFLVPLDTPGIEIRKVNTNGMRGSGTSEIFFDHVFLPDEALLGKDEEGFQAAMQVLGASRIFFSARGLGITEAAVDHARTVLAYKLGTTTLDSKLDRAYQHLHDLELEAFHLRSLVYRVSRLRDAGKPFDHEVAIVKWIAGETAVRVASSAYSLIAGLGASTRELADADRFERDAGQIPLAEGTNEIMERILARNLASSLRSDNGPTITNLLLNPEQLAKTISTVQGPAEAIGLLSTIAKAAYRTAISENTHHEAIYICPEEGLAVDDPEMISLSPIPSPRQEPLGAERALAALEATHFEATTLLNALTELLQEGVEFAAYDTARYFLSNKLGAALTHAEATFNLLNDSYHWLIINSIGASSEGPLLHQMVQKAIVWTFQKLPPINDDEAANRTKPMVPTHVAGGTHRFNSSEIERFRQQPRELGAIEVTEEQVKLFAQVSGDHNPYHLDPEFARKSRYQGPIGHGILTVVLALSEVSRELPSYTPIEVEVRRFTAPVRFGDRVRATILETQPDRDRWRLEYVVTNQDDIPVLDGNLWLRPRTTADGPLSWLQTFESSLSDLQLEAVRWSKDVLPFPVREAPKFALGHSAQYPSTVSEERLKANIALTKDSPWLTLMLAMEAVAQASAELAPGFILVGMESGNCLRPPEIGEALLAKATITRQGTLVHRPLDRIRIEVAVADTQDRLFCNGAVYKESEAPVPSSSIPDSITYTGVEMVVPATERMLNAFARLDHPPFVAILDLDGSVPPSAKVSARGLIIEHLRNLFNERPEFANATRFFLRPNPLRSQWSAADIFRVVGQTGDLLQGVLLPGIESATDVLLLDKLLTGLEQGQGWEIGRLKIELLIQNSRMILQASTLAAASARVAGVVYAPPPNLDTAELRLSLVQAMQDAGIDVVDAVTTPVDDGRQTAVDTLRAVSMGFQRKWALNPIQFNAVLNPQLYLSRRNAEASGISLQWVDRALSHNPLKEPLWSSPRIIRQLNVTNAEPFPMEELETRAANEEPLA